MHLRSVLALLPLLCGGQPSHAGNPVDIHGRLQVSGNRIVGAKSGDTVQLTGMSFFWHQWMGSYYNQKTVDWLVDDFRCSILRAAMGVESGGYLGGGEDGGKRAVRAVVDAATKRGVYSIIDWHSHQAPKNLQAAQDFFDTMSTQYGKNPGVIFEIFNEPWANDYTWKEIKAYEEAVISVIRKHSDNLIILGTRQWSRDVDEASLDSVADPNVAYVLHFYAGSHRDTLRARGQTALDNGKALFISEWGSTLEDGGSDGKIYPEPVADWFRWIDSNKISTCNWSIENKDEASAALSGKTSALSGWDTAKDLTESGRLARAIIRARNTQYTYEAPPIDSSKLPGRIEAESFTTKADLDVMGPGDADNSPYLGNSKVGSWAEYSTVVPTARKAVMALRVGSAEKTFQVTVKVNGVVKATLKASGTGGWGTWATVNTDSFLLAGGAAKIRLEWNGLFDLNWFELTGKVDSSPIPVVTDSTPVAVRVEAESFVKKLGMQVESSGDSDNTNSLGWTYDTTWAEYQADLNPGRQVVALRTASNSNGATLRLKVNDTIKAVVKVPGTGGWQVWKTVVSDSFSVAGGSSKLRMEWIQGDNQAGLVNLNWFEFRSRPASSAVARKVAALESVRWVGGKLRIEGSVGTRVAVYDAAGKCTIPRREMALGAVDLDLPGAPGRYFVQVSDSRGARTIPVVRF